MCSEEHSVLMVTARGGTMVPERSRLSSGFSCSVWSAAVQKQACVIDDVNGLNGQVNTDPRFERPVDVKLGFGSRQRATR